MPPTGLCCLLFAVFAESILQIQKKKKKTQLTGLTSCTLLSQRGCRAHPVFHDQDVGLTVFCFIQGLINGWTCQYSWH